MINNMKRPNVIYILADDMGYGDVSYLNEKAAFKTSNFDRLCREGMAFTDAHSSSAVCTPSRYSILTGRYNWRSSLKSNVLGGYSPSLIERGRMTVASMLRTVGYNTACIGKWHLGLDWGRTELCPEAPNFGTTEGIDYSARIGGGPVDHGFDYFYGISASLDMPPYVYIENDRVTELPEHETENSGMGFWRKGPTAPDFKHKEVLQTLTDKVKNYIEDKAQEPFFVYFPLPAPHTPILPTGKFIGKSGTNAYGDFVLMCDDVVGQILDKLEEKGITENTILIYTSDNGCSPQADLPALLEFGHNPNYVFRGHKADIYEGGHRIPLIVRWPEGIRAGSICNETVCLTDFIATMAELLEVKLPDCAAEDSVSNLSLWENKKLDSPLREATVHHSFNGSFSIRKDKWKLELCPGSGGWSSPRPGKEAVDAPRIQLYDLSLDISEQKNVYLENPEVVNELKSLLIKYVMEGRSTPGSPQTNTGPEYWEELKWMKEEKVME